MSASLVGSEMCIRDRTRSLRPARQGDPGTEAPPLVPPRGRRRTPSDRPVSYTHLTLPTICSV
eukprot:1095736-Alexandrium_andersonii.AAC.1